MTSVYVDLMHLPNEILFNILKKLDNINVLYTFIGIGIRRLELLAKDKVFTNTLNFTLIDNDDNICLLPDPVMNRFYIDILPQIQYNIRSLVLDSTSMETILLIGDYPNLTQLKIFKFNRNFVSRYFIDEGRVGHIYQKQITDLTFISNKADGGQLTDYTMNVYDRILNFCQNLTHLSMSGLLPSLLLRNLPLTTFSSSILTKLCINVDTFNDCLVLLGGRLKQLTTLVVSVDYAKEHSSTVNNLDDLPNVKCFSLEINYLYIYDTDVVPLLRRMINLEKLTLDLSVYNRARHIDGLQLQNDLLIHLQQLQTFVFYIHTRTDAAYSDLSITNDDLQRTFTNFKYGPTHCFIDYDISRHSIFHIFSLPFAFNRWKRVHNVFPNLIFNNVTLLVITSSTLLKHEFFVRLAQSFPSLKSLEFGNLYRQSSDSDGNELYLPVEYPHLRSLDIVLAHIDYIDQFLNESKTHLPNLIELEIEYDALKTVTKDFTRDATRINCSKVKQLTFGDNEPIVQPKDFYIYFPLL